MDGTDAVTHFRHKWHAYENKWRDFNSADIRIFMDHLVIMGLVQK